MITLPGGVVLSDGFFAYLIPMASRIGSRPEDVLVVLSSESGLNPASTKGMPYHGLNTIGANEALGIGLTAQEWADIPTMTPEQNLPIVEKYYTALLSKVGRKGFANALDLYLSNAGYGIWALGHIDPNQVMYPAGSAWNGNYALDNYPAAVGKTLAQANAMVQSGDLKGYISVDDLRRFMLRDNVKPIWKTAVKGLYDYMAVAGISRPGGVYQPASVSTPSYEPGTSYDDINAMHAGGRAPPQSGAGSVPVSQSSGLSWWQWLLVAAGGGLVVRKVITK